VEQQYAACASLVASIKSIYRWRGQVEQARLDIYPDGGLARLRLFGELA